MFCKFDVAEILVCPNCKNSLTISSNEIACENCIEAWPIKGGIPFFYSSGDELDAASNDNGIDRLASLAETTGWENALFEFTKLQLMRGETPKEDLRSTDWLYLLSLDSDSVVLVLGCGLGTVPIALSERCKLVYAVDSSWDQVKFLNIRKTQQGIDNLFPIYVSGELDLPINTEKFDFVAVTHFPWNTTAGKNFADFTNFINGLLIENGEVYLRLGNKLAFRTPFLYRPSNKAFPLHTVFTYKRILKAKGFNDIQIYAPLPRYDRIPLFYVPVENTSALKFFFRTIFPLFEMASPEVKRNYALEYTLAKIGVKLAILFRLTSLAKIFVPGFGIIAKKKNNV